MASICLAISAVEAETVVEDGGGFATPDEPCFDLPGIRAVALFAPALFTRSINCQNPRARPKTKPIQPQYCVANRRSSQPPPQIGSTAIRATVVIRETHCMASATGDPRSDGDRSGDGCEGLSDTRTTPSRRLNSESITRANDCPFNDCSLSQPRTPPDDPEPDFSIRKPVADDDF